MHKPVVDVVLATNRRSPYLAQALASVASQDYRHWQLMLVDDGCRDARFLVEALREIPEGRIIQQAPAGVAAARNAGMEAGQGEFVAFLDDDDIWAPDKLSAQVDALLSAPTSVGCYTAGWYMDARGEAFGVGWPARMTTSADFISGRVPTPRIVTLMVRREALLTLGGFNETYSLAEDNEFILRLLQHGELACVPEPMVGYRRHDANTSTPGSLEGRKANRRLLLEQIDAARRRGDVETCQLLAQRLILHRRECAEETVRGVADATRRGDSWSSIRQLAWGLRVSPRGVVTSAFSKVMARTVGAVMGIACKRRGPR